MLNPADHTHLAHIRRMVALATRDAFNGGRAMTFRGWNFV